MKKQTIILALFVFTLIAQSQSPIKVNTRGEGKSVILLPGFASSEAVWDNLLTNITSSYTFHLISYAGFNGNEAIATPWYPEIKEAIINYINTEDLSDVTLIGHSMGGNLAVDLAEAFPDRVSGLILLDVVPCMSELMMPGVPASAIQYDSPYNNQLLEMTDEAFAQMAEGMAWGMTNNASMVPILTQWIKEADRETYVYGYTDLMKLDQREQLSRITVPTLILGADFPTKEQVLSTYENQYENLNNKDIVIADNSKHFIMFDQPEWLSTQINEYLNAPNR